MFNTPFTFTIKEEEEKEDGPTHQTFNITNKHDQEVGSVSVSWGDESLDDYSIELLEFNVNEGFDPLKVGMNVITTLFRKLDWAKRIYLMTNKDNAPFWRKLGFTHIDRNIYYRDRH